MSQHDEQLDENGEPTTETVEDELRAMHAKIRRAPKGKDPAEFTIEEHIAEMRRDRYPHLVDEGGR